MKCYQRYFSYLKLEKISLVSKERKNSTLKYSSWDTLCRVVIVYKVPLVVPKQVIVRTIVFPSTSMSIYLHLVL